MKDEIKKTEKKIGSTVEQIVKWYDDSVTYQTALGLRTSAPENVRFYEGDQWAAPTKATKHFPRPVINFIEMICNNKKSQITSSPVKLIYKSDAPKAATDKFNQFASYEQVRLKQPNANDKAVLDGMLKGSYCFYYFWDDGIVGLDGLVEGDMGLQVLDPLDVHFADPQEEDEQKQEWIMLVSREDSKKVKEAADGGVNVSLIEGDDNDSVYSEMESETTKYVTVFTRFFRHNDEVYFEKATRQVMFNEARPLTPNAKKAKDAIEGKEEQEEEPKPEDKYLKGKQKAVLYPIVFSSWKKRNKSIYGRGEVEKLIPNQKAVNWSWGLQLLVLQFEGMGVWTVKPDALKGQQITNEPGQVLTDYSKAGNGINRVQSQGMSQGSSNIADKLTDITRVVSGASEVMNGELISAGMSGAAIAQLQAQALKPIEDLQKGFWRAIEKAGAIYEQFLRLQFSNKKFKYEAEESTPKNPKYISESFSSEEYEDIRFDVVAEAVAGTVMSDVANINLLDTLFAKQAISLKTYIKSYPENALADRQKLLSLIEAEEQEVINQLAAQLEQAKQQLEQAAAVLQAQEQTISNAKVIVDENRTLKEKLLELQAAYAQKIMDANKILVGLAERTKSYYGDAQEFAGELAKERGLTPGGAKAVAGQQKPKGNPSGNPL